MIALYYTSIAIYSTFESALSAYLLWNPDGQKILSSNESSQCMREKVQVLCDLVL